MRKAAIFSVLALLIFCVVMKATGAFELAYKTGYICTDSEGKERWHATSTVVLSEEKDKLVNLLTEKGEGMQSGYEGKISWTTTLEYQILEGSVKPLEMERTVFDEQDQLIAVEYQRFDYSNNKVLFEAENMITKKKIKKEMGFSGDIVNRLSLVIYTKQFLKDGKKEATVTMLTDDPMLFKLKIKVIGTEELDVDHHKEKAYKILLDPQLGMLDVVKIFLPKMYIWNDSGPSFDWLKYVGPETTSKSPIVEIEWTPKYSGSLIINRILEDLGDALQKESERKEEKRDGAFRENRELDKRTG